VKEHFKKIIYYAVILIIIIYSYTGLLPIQTVAQETGNETKEEDLLKESAQNQADQEEVEQTAPVIKEIWKNHPALEVMKYYQSVTGAKIDVVPHLVNIMAADLLRSSNLERLAVVRNYITWYFNHLNYADKYDITGSMYDYTVFTDSGHRELSLKRSNSICRYAGTFLMLLGRYAFVSGDWKLLDLRRKNIEDLAYNIPFLQREDGLIRPFPKQESVFLVDNCEAFVGLSAVMKISKQLNWNIDKYYGVIRQRIYEGFWNTLYHSAGKTFYESIDEKGKHLCQWEKFPDAYNQLMPLVYDMLHRNRSIRRNTWKRFRKFHLKKMSGITDVTAEQKIIYRWVEQYVKGRRLWADVGNPPPPPPVTMPVDVVTEPESTGRILPGTPTRQEGQKVMKKNRIDVQYFYEYLSPYNIYGAWESYYIKYYRYQTPTFNFFIHGGMVKREHKNDYIGLLGFAKDWSPRLYTYTVVAKGTISNYLPNARIDHDFNFKLGKARNFMWTIGATYIKYYVPAEDVIVSTGFVWYLPKWVLSYRLFWNHKYPGNIQSLSHLAGIEHGIDKSRWTSLTASWGSQAYLALYVLVPEQIRQSAFNINIGHRQWFSRGFGAFIEAGYLDLDPAYRKYLLSAGLFVEF